MKVFDTVAGMSSFAANLRTRGRTICLVPTMGALHAGHLSLFHHASSVADTVLASIYVNPTQFAPGEDLSSYPRDIEGDLQKCRESGVSAVFTPSDHVMYAPRHSTYVEEISLSRGLCGAARPSHFKGVTTIVSKLFNIVQPHSAVFGKKDAQQARIIMRMVEDLNIPVTIHLAPTVRESDGLAMSSRNKNLSAEERQRALKINAALTRASELFASGTTDPAQLKKEMLVILEPQSPAVTVDYIEIVSDTTLEPLAQISENALIAIAARVGRTRLIDNIEISVK